MRVRIIRWMSSILLVSTVACGLEQHSLAPASDSANLLQAVQLEYHAYNLSQVAPYDTVTLHVRGVSGTNGTIDAPVTFAYDSRYVTVSPAGVLTATAPVASTVVTATMSYGGATRVDTALVSVISGAPQFLAHVGIAVNAGDSAKVAVPSLGTRFSKILKLVRTDSNGVALTTGLVSVRSSDTATAKVTVSGTNVSVTAVRVGRVVFRASTYAYGVGLRDSLIFTVGWPIIGYLGFYERYPTGSLTPVLGSTLGKVTLGMGACVAFQNTSQKLDMDVVFDDPTQVLPPDSASAIVRTLCITDGVSDTTNTGQRIGGNIGPWHYIADSAGNPIESQVYSYMRARALPHAGTYTYHSVQYGLDGTIVVCDEAHDATCAPENYQWGVSSSE